MAMHQLAHRLARPPTIRHCRRADLGALEWDGEFSHDREIIEWTFARMRAGTMVMLVAEETRTITGQIWINFARWPDSADLWALRVKEPWQGRGIGSRLLDAAEQVCARRGFAAAGLDVHPANPARRLYERRGYRHVRCDLARDGSGRVLGPALLGMRKVLPGGS